MKVILLGWNGALNAGDDAMTLSMLLELNKNDKISEVELISRTTKANFSYLDNYNFNYKVIINDFLLKYNNKYFKYFYQRLVFPFKLVFKHDYIIIGGGTIFHSSGDNFIYSYTSFLSKIVRLFKKSRIYIFGCSIGPFNSIKAEKLFSSCYKRMDKVIVRDIRSYDYCKNLDKASNRLALEKDLALALPAYKAFKPCVINEYNRKYIVVILRRNHVSTEQYNWLTSFLTNFIAINKEMEIVFSTFCDLDNYLENDKLEIDSYIQSLSGDLIKKIRIKSYNENLKDVYTLIRNSEFVISSRLHGGIISHSLGKKFVMLSYHVKCSDFYEFMGLDKIGLVDSKHLEKVNFTDLVPFLESDVSKTKNEELEWLNPILEM